MHVKVRLLLLYTSCVYVAVHCKLYKLWASCLVPASLVLACVVNVVRCVCVCNRCMYMTVVANACQLVLLFVSGMQCVFVIDACM